MTADSHPTHHVVFDCNVALNVYRHFGPVKSIEDIRALNSKHHGQSPAPPRFDAIHSLTLAAGGSIGDADSVVVHSTEHIQKTVLHKASQPLQEKAGVGNSRLPEDYGLGLTRADSRGLVSATIQGPVDATGGFILENSLHSAEKTPPLDHEDGMVFGACKWLASCFPLDTIWCLTYDKNFIADAKKFSESSYINVCYPSEYVTFHRSTAHKAVMARLASRPLRIPAK